MRICHTQRFCYETISLHKQLTRLLRCHRELILADLLAALREPSRAEPGVIPPTHPGDVALNSQPNPSTRDPY